MVRCNLPINFLQLTNTCKGDSGGPLTCNGKLTGVVSFGNGKCANASSPDVYTKIQHYIDWIERNLVSETTVAAQGQFPYQISWCYNETVMVKEENQTTCFHFCGGSILNRKTIITAAHCCDKIESPKFTNKDKEIIGWSDTIIVAGILNELSESESKQSKIVKSHIMHPDYDKSTHQNDICLLTLDSPFTFDDHVDKIILDYKTPLVDNTCQVSGWADREVFVIQFSLPSIFI